MGANISSKLQGRMASELGLALRFGYQGPPKVLRAHKCPEQDGESHKLMGGSQKL